MGTSYDYFEDTEGMPIITLEVMPDSEPAETVPYDSFFPSQQNNAIDEDMKDPNGIPFLIDKNDVTTGMHFLVDKSDPTEINGKNPDQEAKEVSNMRRDLLEYITRSNGSVCCKICGKILASRTHWYRHKYRAHSIHPVNRAPLFQCEQCLIYFKSRKGYIGHIASKHSETLQDARPVLTNAQAEALAKEKSIIQKRPIQSEPIQPEAIQPEPIKLEPLQLGPMQPAPMEAEMKKDPELSIPKTIVPTYQNVAVKQTGMKSPETTQRKSTRTTRQSMTHSIDVVDQTNEENDNEWKQKRSREEKLVADIIARVRRECEAQGSGGSARRGYSRKTGLHT